MQKSITIIVRCNNEASWLDTSQYINSLVKYRDVSIVCIDDGSQDRTIKTLQEIKNQTSGQTTIIAPGNQLR